jgi:hypothetical protein
LEDNKYGDNTDRDNLTENSRKENQIEGVNKDPHQVDDKDAHQDIWRTCTLQTAVSAVEECSHQGDIYNINEF